MREKNTIPLRSLISSIMTVITAIGTIFVVGGLIAYLSASRSVNIKVSARGIGDSVKSVMVRLTSPTDTSKVLHLAEMPVNVQNGSLIGSLTSPSGLIDQSYIVEICSAIDGNKNDCFKQDSSNLLYSCPYFVSASKSSKVANLLNQNQVDLDSRMACGDTTDEFSNTSRLNGLAMLQIPGLSSSVDGVVVLKNGKLEALTFGELLKEQPNPNTSSNVETPQIIQQFYPATHNTNNTYVTNLQTPPSQTLFIEGRQLAISGGNSVELPEDKDTVYSIASATDSGILSSEDWNLFASKEHSLIFDNSFERWGAENNNISLISCAANQILKHNGSRWLCAEDMVGKDGLNYTAGTGLSLNGVEFNNTGVISVSASGALTVSSGQNPVVNLTTSSDFEQLATGLSLKNILASPGTYNSVTVDSKGRITGGTNISYLTAEVDGIVGNEVSGVVNDGGLLLSGAGTAADPYKVGLITTCQDGQLLKYVTSSGWTCSSDLNTHADPQTLIFNSATDKLTISGGGQVDLSSLRDNTDNQTLTISGAGATRELTISGGNSVVISDNDNQQLSFDQTTRTISLTNGGQISLPAETVYLAGSGLKKDGNTLSVDSPTCASTDKLVWNGAEFLCAKDVDTNTVYANGNGIDLKDDVFSIKASACSTGEYLTWNGLVFRCETDNNSVYIGSTGISVDGGVISNTGVLSFTAGNGLVNSGTGTAPIVQLSNTSVTTGSYGKSNKIAVFSVDQQGRLTAASELSINDLDASTISSGILSVNRGGTGIDGSAAQVGQLLIGNGSGYSLGTISGTANQIAVINDAGGITLSTPQDLATTSNVTFGSIVSSGDLIVNGATNLNGHISFGNTVDDTVTLNGVLAGALPLKFEGLTIDGKILSVEVVDPQTSSKATIPLLPNDDTFVFANLDQVLNNKTVNNLVLNGTVTGSAISDDVNLLDNSSSLLVTQHAVKTYIDNKSMGLNWQPALSVLNLIGFATAPPNTPSRGDVYIIEPGGNTGAWSTFMAGDTVAFDIATSQWKKVDTVSVGDRYGISIKSNTAPTGPLASYDQGTITITGGSPGNWTYNLVQPLNNDAFYIDNPNSSLNGQTLVYSGSLHEWVQMSASTDYDFTHGLERNGNTVGISLFSEGGLELNGSALALKNCPVGQVLKNNGVNAYSCSPDNDTLYTAGHGLTVASNQFSLNAPTCTNNQFLTWDGSDFSCGALPIDTDTTNFNVAANMNAVDNIASGDTIRFNDGVGVSVSQNGKNFSFGLADVGVAGTYGSSNSVPVITTDAHGRVTSVSQQAIPVASATATGLLSAEHFIMLSQKENTLSFTGRNLFNRDGNTIAATACDDGKIMKYNVSAGIWECSSDNDTKYIAGSGIDITNSTVRNLGVLSLTSGNNPIVIGGASQNPTVGFQNGTLANQFWNWNGTEWQLTSTPVDTNTTYSAGQGLELSGTEFKLAQRGATTGQILKWNGTDWTPADDIDHDSQTLSYNSTNKTISISNGNQISFPEASASVTGLLSASDWQKFNGKENILSFSGSGLFSRSGDSVTGLSCAVAGQAPVWDGTKFSCQTPPVNTYTADTSLNLSNNQFSINCAAGSSVFCNGGNNFGDVATIGTNDNFALNFETNAVTKMTIDAGGNVGIGTTAPSSALQLHRSSSVANAIKITNGATGLNSGDGVEFGIDAAGNAEIRQRENASIHFITNNTQRLAIDTSGNLLLPSRTVAGSMGPNWSPTSGTGLGSIPTIYSATGSISSSKPIIMRQYLWNLNTNNDWMTIKTGVSATDYAAAAVSGVGSKWGLQTLRGMETYMKVGADGNWEVYMDADSVIDKWTLTQVIFYRSEISSRDFSTATPVQ